MAKKLLKGDIVDALLTTEKQKDVMTEKQKTVKTEERKGEITEKRKNVEKVKVTLYLSPEDDLLIDEIRRRLNYRREGKKLSRSDVVARALRELARQLGVTSL